MISLIKSLEGKVVRDVNYIDQTLILYLEEDIILSIHNNFSSNLEDFQFQNLFNRKLLFISEVEKQLNIKFDNNLWISVDLRDESYNGPEAIELLIPGEPIIIWN